MAEQLVKVHFLNYNFTQSLPSPHQGSDPRQRGDNSGGGIVSEPDGLIAALTLLPKGRQHVNLTLWSRRSSSEKRFEAGTHINYSTNLPD